MLSRYHLWFAVPSRKTASWSANTLPRGNGRSRSTPTGLWKKPLGCQLQGVFAVCRSPLFTNQGFSWQCHDGYWSSSSLYAEGILSDSGGIVNQIREKL